MVKIFKNYNELYEYHYSSQSWLSMYAIVMVKYGKQDISPLQAIIKKLGSLPVFPAGVNVLGNNKYNLQLFV